MRRVDLGLFGLYLSSWSKSAGFISLAGKASSVSISMLSYFYDPSIFIYCWNSNFVENVVFEREHAWRPRCHLLPPACVLYCVEHEFDQIIMKLYLRLTAE